VCGMTIAPADAVGKIEHRGRTHYFCAQSCLETIGAIWPVYKKRGEGLRPRLPRSVSYQLIDGELLRISRLRRRR